MMCLNLCGALAMSTKLYGTLNFLHATFWLLLFLLTNSVLPTAAATGE